MMDIFLLLNMIYNWNNGIITVIHFLSIIIRSHNPSHNLLMRFSQTSLLKRSIFPTFHNKAPKKYNSKPPSRIVDIYKGILSFLHKYFEIPWFLNNPQKTMSFLGAPLGQIFFCTFI